MSIEQAKKGQRFKILGYDALQSSASYRHRLLALGLVPGMSFVVKHLAPLGDPIQIDCMGTALMLRKSEAACLQVKTV